MGAAQAEPRTKSEPALSSRSTGASTRVARKIGVQNEPSRKMALRVWPHSPSIQRACNCGGGSMAEDGMESNAVVQPSLTISSPGDHYEVEADRVADEVMGMTDSAEPPRRIRPSPEDAALKRQCASCAANDSYGDDVSSLVARSVSGGGHPLDSATRSFMEPRFGSDFSAVRLYTGSRAAASARAINAMAYTVGSDIFFASGNYAPSTTIGRRLLAHELTHVIQQKNGAAKGSDGITSTIQRQTSSPEDRGREEEKKPKTPFDPPDQLGKCSFDILHPENFVNCCTEAIGDADICTDQILDFFKGFKGQCPPAAKKPDGKCCPLPMIWDGTKCSKTTTPPIPPEPTLPPVVPCLPGEIPTLFGGCCRPGATRDPEGRPCLLVVPPDKKPVPVPPTPTITEVFFLQDRPRPDESGGITAEGQTNLAALIKQLADSPNLKVQLVGTASVEGPSPDPARYNRELGARRAQLVAKLLKVDPTRIADTPVDDLQRPECENVTSGIVTCGSLRAYPTPNPRDRRVLARVFAPP